MEALATLYLDEKTNDLLDYDTIEQISIVSKIEVIVSTPPADCYFLESNNLIGVIVSKMNGEKCERCWKYFSSLENNLCKRCVSVI